MAEKKTSDAQIKATEKYDRENTRRISLKINTKTEADIWEWFSKQENKQGAIKALIREAIAKE